MGEAQQQVLEMPELLATIFRFLSPAFVLRVCALVCSAWHTASREELLWQYFYRQRWDPCSSTVLEELHREERRWGMTALQLYRESEESCRWDPVCSNNGTWWVGCAPCCRLCRRRRREEECSCC